jgi:hypothetical protein
MVKRSQGHPSATTVDTRLPSLPLDSWAATKDTLHLWFQVVGKIKLAYMPPKNHWWHVTFHLDLRGFTTGRIPVDKTKRLEIRFDLLNHFVSIATNAGEEARLVLSDGLSVAAFDREIHSMLEGIGVDVTIVESPYGVPMKTQFTEDVEHASYDRDAVARLWRILDWSGTVFEEFSGWFCGKTSPVQLYWHSLDLAFSRFNGSRAPARPNADLVTQEAYSHEVIAFGFWAGDQSLPEPSYYSYTAPEPADLRLKALPSPAQWSERNGGSLALLPLEAVRSAPDPKTALLEFLQSAYEAGASAAGWDMAALESAWCPGPRELSLLTATNEEVR